MVAARRVMKSHMHFVEMHLDSTGFLATTNLPPAAAGEHRCPHHSFCELAARQETPEVCSQRPWEYAHWDTNERCWNAEGIAATFGVFSTRPTYRS
jgi:hypothetical protein